MDYEPTGSLPPEGPAAPKPRARKAATKKEFLQLPRNKGLKVCILASAILCYVLAGLGTLVLVTAILDPEVNAVAEIGILLTILILGHLIFALPLGLGIHLRQSRVCAVLLLLLAALGIALDRFLGFEIALISCAVVLALYGTFLLEKRWRAYRDAEPWQSEVSRAYEEPDAEPTISRKEFLELPENEKLKKRIHTNANACYVLLGVSAVFCAILTAVEYLSVSDLVLEMILLGVILTLVVGVHKRQSLTCGVALGVIVALSALLALIEGESRGLSLAELACIGLFAQSIQLEQQRKKYCQKQAQSPGAQPEPNSDPKGETPMKYVCPCGYEYDPAVGDPDNGVAPGTPFEAIPDSWVCPVCGLGKGEFVPA